MKSSNILTMMAMVALMWSCVRGKVVTDWSECVGKSFGHSSIVCVCNNTYCDLAQEINSFIGGQPVLVASDQEGKRFERIQLKWKNKNEQQKEKRNDCVKLLLNRDKRRQSIIGWGNAITDSVAINVNTLSLPTQNNLLKSYYGKHGLNLGLARTNMGGCDFSNRTYSHAPIPDDFDLKHFSLQIEDKNLKIPLIKRINHLMGDNELKLIASPWSPPPWMKTNNDYSGRGFLKKNCNSVWANYFVRYFEEYSKLNVSFWGLTVQNEPETGYIPFWPFNAMGMSPSTEQKFVYKHLGPALKKAGLSNLHLMAGDTQRPLLPSYAHAALRDPRSERHISGLAVHWYMDDVVPLTSALDEVHNEFPNKFILYTEASNGYHYWDFEKVKLGDWNRGEWYLNNILEDLRHWVSGWVDWNLALNKKGGPNWARNFVDAAVIVDEDNFYKQPMYYALGHISRFIPENSIILELEHDKKSQSDGNLNYVSAIRPDGGITHVILNRRSDKVQVEIRDGKEGVIQLLLQPKSFNTIVY